VGIRRLAADAVKRDHLYKFVCVDESIHIQKLNKFIGVVAECIAIERKIWFDAESEVRQDRVLILN